MPSGDGTPRTYSIATDTATGAVNPTMLEDEINADPGITTAYSHEETTGDVLDLYFAAALSAPEITALDAVVAAHQGIQTSEVYRDWESNTAQQESTTTWTEKFSRTPTALKAGTYRLSYSFELRVNPTGPVNSEAEARFLVDGNVKANAFSDRDKYQVTGSWDRYSAKEGDTPTLSLEIRKDPAVGGNDSAQIRKMKLGVQYMGS